jgi:two-component system chemotaxis response regulator CheB
MVSTDTVFRNIVVIGASAGAVPVLQRLVAALPADFPAAVLITVHIWPRAESFLPDILGRAGPLPVHSAENGAPILPGNIYIAPVDQHLMIDDGRLCVVRGPRENRFRPAINPLFRSAAIAFRQRVIGVILTGMLDDGVAGLWAVKQCGGVAIVQSDAQFDEMPRQAAEAVSVDHSVPIEQMAALLVRLVREPLPGVADVPVPQVLKLNDQKSKMKPTAIDVDQVGRRVPLSCPECGGALWEVNEGQLLFSCHVGHAYSIRGLDEAQGISIEQSMWSAVRALKENGAMYERLAQRAKEQGLGTAAALYQRTADERHAEAATLQTLLARPRPPRTADGTTGRVA